MKRLLFFFAFILISCSENTKVEINTSPYIEYSLLSFNLINNSGQDFYNLKIYLENDYFVEYNVLPKAHTIHFNNKMVKKIKENNFINGYKYIIKYQDINGNEFITSNKNKFKIIKEIDNNFFLEIIKIVVAVFLALIAAFFTLLQVKSNVISSSRIRWIESFKNDISEYTASVKESYTNHKNYNLNGLSKIDKDFFYKEYSKAHTNSLILSSRIFLNLNIEENLHKNLEAILENIIDMTGSMEKINEEELNQKLIDLIDKSKIIFKLEWEKSKKIFVNFKFKNLW